MKYEQLITTISQCIKSFNQITHSVDTHAEEFLKKIKNDNEKVFIKQVFYGVQRYDEFLKVFTTSLFSDKTVCTNRNDGTLYQIFLYLILFRLEELPHEEFKKLILSQDAVKMNAMLQFLFDMKKINDEKVKEGWCKILDPNYVEEKILQGLEEKVVILNDILQIISQKATGKKSDLVQEVQSDDSQSQTLNNNDTFTHKKLEQPTTCKPFNLRQPKPRALPEPIIIPKNVKANPVPKTIYKESYEQLKEKNEERLQKTKKETKEKYKNSSIQRFDFETEKRPTNIAQITKEVEGELSQKLQFNKKYHQKLPKFDEKPAEVRMNVAMILKEENKLKKVKEEEEKIIQDYEINMRDSSEFNEWRNKQQAIEDHQKLERLNQKKIEMELAREAATKAMKEKFGENHDIANEMKQITKEKLIEKEENIQEDLKVKKKLIAGVIETRENGQIEKQKVAEKNKDLHNKNKQDIKDALDKKKVEDQIEYKKKQELIKQIRDLEQQPRERTKGYDPTETMGHGLLEEMSLFELRERMEQLKIERKEEREQRRLENLSKKDQKLVELQSKVGQISQYRNQQSKIKQEQREEKKRKKQEEQRLNEEIRQQQRLEVYSKIVDKKKAKKEEEDKLAKDLREIRIKRQFLNANEAMVEAKAWKSLQDGAEREILDRQNNKLIHHEKIEAINFKEKKLQAMAAKNEVDSLVGFLQEFDERFEVANKENEILHRQIREDYQKKYQTIKNFEIQHTKNLEERDTYKTKISQLSLSTAKQLESKKTKTSKKKEKNEDFSLPPAQYAPIQEEAEAEN